MFAAGPVSASEADAVYWEPGRLADRVVVEWREGARPRGRPRGVGRTTVIEGDELVATDLLQDPEVERVWMAFAPVRPPDDLPPETPDFRDDQAWLGAFAFDQAWAWPGGNGQGLRVADVEYSWEPAHEDLPAVSAWGVDYADYRFHGASVLGILAAPDNGYGVTGGAPAAELVVYHPFPEPGEYDVAAAIVAATAELGPGDVILIEQQGYVDGWYCPVSVDPTVREAIAAAVEAGIVVVEPGGNGAADLDDPMWEGAFGRALDPGSILVGGADEAGEWEGSSYNGRVDLAAWYRGIVSTSAGDYGAAYADLWFPDGDGRQAYTQSFGGTSGASALVAAMAAVIQGVAMETRGGPLEPRELRALLVSTAWPEPEQATHIGGLPDLRRALRSALLP